MLAPISGARKRGASSFAALARYLEQSVDPVTGEVVQRGEMAYSENILSPETAVAEMRAVAGENTRVRDPVYHYQVSWQEGESPTREQWISATKTSIEALGFGEHQFVIAAHADTDNFHVHVMINRVHPETYLAHYPAFSKRALDKCMREVEAAQGWREDPGLFRWDKERGIAVQNSAQEMQRQREARGRGLGIARANRLEHFADTESLQGYAKGAPARALREVLGQPGTGWQHVHATLREHGLELTPSARGGYAVRALGSEFHVKASDVFRANFSGRAERAALDAKLGAFEPPARFIAARKPERAYTAPPFRRDPALREERRLARAQERQALRAEFRADHAKAKKALHGYDQGSRDRLRALGAAAKAAREQVRTLGLPTAEARAMRSVLAAEAVQAREALKAELADERAALQPKGWRAWLEDRASQGDDRALSALRGLRYQEARTRAVEQHLDRQGIPQIRGQEREDAAMGIARAIASMEHQIDRLTGHVAYSMDGRQVLLDTGRRVNMLDTSDVTLVAGLKLAREKFGSQLELHGSEDAVRRMVELSVKHKLGVTFTDPRLNDLQQRLSMQQRDADIARVLRPVLVAERTQAFEQIHKEDLQAPVRGVVVARGVANELTGSEYLAVAGADGKVRYVGLSAHAERHMDAPAKVGEIVELSRYTPPPATAADRALLAQASRHDGVYDPRQHLRSALDRGMDDSEADAYVDAHKRRAEALAARGHVERLEGDRYRIPADLEQRLDRELAAGRDRATFVRVTAPSRGDFRNAGAMAYTALDQEIERGTLGALQATPQPTVTQQALRDALEARVQTLDKAGLLEHGAAGVPRLASGAAAKLADLELEQASKALSRTHGTYGPLDQLREYRGTLVALHDLPSGRFAVVADNENTFTLAPAPKNAERMLGKPVNVELQANRHLAERVHTPVQKLVRTRVLTERDLGRDRGLSL